MLAADRWTRRRAGVASIVLLLSVAAAPACSDGDPRSVAGFCALLREEGATLTDTSDPAGLAERYRVLEERVPLQIKDQWHEVAVLLERVTTFNPKDDADTQALLAESLKAKTSIDALAEWADSKCKVPLGEG
jgi:hypothetical protein